MDYSHLGLLAAIATVTNVTGGVYKVLIHVHVVELCLDFQG